MFKFLLKYKKNPKYFISRWYMCLDWFVKHHSCDKMHTRFGM